MEKIQEYNDRILKLMSRYLNEAPTLIKKELVDQIASECSVAKEYAFAVLLAAACGLDTESVKEDAYFFQYYFLPMIHQLKVEEFQDNSYYRTIHIPSVKTGEWHLYHEKYQPFEGFVCDDFIEYEDGRVIPQIGFFDKEFVYPSVEQRGREWMTITPNEIRTMEQPVQEAYGEVVTFGLGLGYYAYMVSQKREVDTVTIVERDQEVIELFQKYILPQFPEQDKIRIIKSDAFQYAQDQVPKENYDYAFIDLWHDVSDGKAMYLKMKEYEALSPNTTFRYWIEKTIQHYIEE